MRAEGRGPDMTAGVRITQTPSKNSGKERSIDFKHNSVCCTDMISV